MADQTDNPTRNRIRPMEDEWSYRADWVEAEDGTVVCLAPGGNPLGVPLDESRKLWPARRPLIAAAPQMLAALRDLMTVRPNNWDDGDDPDMMQAYGAAEAAIAAAEGR